MMKNRLFHSAVNIFGDAMQRAQNSYRWKYAYQRFPYSNYRNCK